MSRVAIEPQFQPFVLKDYRYWTLLLNERQRYLGRAVAWLARPGKMQRFSDLLQEELIELQYIAQEYEAALDRMGWYPDHVNYAMLGNYIHEHDGHGHLHIIPRYKPRVYLLMFMNVTFVDDRWGQNYSPETPMNVPPEVIAGLVRSLKEELG